MARHRQLPDGVEMARPDGGRKASRAAIENACKPCLPAIPLASLML
jgi:hypothetical protein